MSRWNPDGHLKNFVRAALGDEPPSAPFVQRTQSDRVVPLEINQRYRESHGSSANDGGGFKDRLAQGWPADFAKNAARL